MGHHVSLHVYKSEAFKCASSSASSKVSTFPKPKFAGNGLGGFQVLDQLFLNLFSFVGIHDFGHQEGASLR